MPLPTVITDLSTTAASNYPAGSDSPATLDDVQRAHAAFIAQLRDNPTANATTITPITKGGTGQITAGAALTALGAAASGANTDITSVQGGVFSLVRDYTDGLGQSSPGGTVNHTVSAGVALDSTNTFLMRLASALTKTTSNWVVGSAAGGKFRAAAIAASTSYWWYVVRRPDTGVVDVGFSTSATGLVAADFVAGGGNLPDAYTQWRSLHGVKTDGSSFWKAMWSQGDSVFFSVAPIIQYNSSGHGTTTTLIQLPDVPQGRIVRVRWSEAYTFNAGATAVSYMWNPIGGSGGATGDQFVARGAANQFGAFGTDSIGTDSSARIYIASDTASTTIYAQLAGWTDTRGRDA